MLHSIQPKDFLWDGIILRYHAANVDGIAVKRENSFPDDSPQWHQRFCTRGLKAWVCLGLNRLLLPGPHFLDVSPSVCNLESWLSFLIRAPPRGWSIKTSYNSYEALYIYNTEFFNLIGFNLLMLALYTWERVFGASTQLLGSKYQVVSYEWKLFNGKIQVGKFIVK